MNLRLRSLFPKRASADHRATDTGSLGLVEPFDQDGLARLTSMEDYAAAEPFPHLVIDNFFDPRALDQVLSEWPQVGEPDIDSYHDGTHTTLKYASNFRTKFEPYTRFVLSRLGEPVFLETLEKVTGIHGLVPDPYWWGGGLHFTRASGRLAIHADFNKHFKFNLDRRVNLLVYLNRGWTERNQGWLELWDREVKTCVKRILPIFNRTVVFSTTDFSFHGQPEPIQGPPDLFRKSIALFYYSNGRPPEEISDRDSPAPLWRQRPGRGY